MNQKGFVGVFIIAILLVGIWAAVYLSQSTQVFKPKASETLVEDGEYGSLPISQVPFKSTRPANAIKLWPGQMLILDNPLILDFIASHYEYVNVDASSTKIIDYLKSKNPQLKILVGVGGVAQTLPNYAHYKYLSESDFLHSKLNPSQRIKIQDHELLNIGSPQTRQNLVNALKKVLAEEPNIDGLLLDGYHPWAGGVPVECFETTQCNVDKWRTTARESDYWYSGYKAFNKLAKEQIGKELFFNGINPSWDMASDVGIAWNGWAGDFNGAYVEHTEYGYIKTEYFDRLLLSIREMVNSGKKILFNGEPGLLLGTNNGVIPEKNLSLQRFFLATFLLINNGSTTYYGFVPGEPDPSDISNVYYYKDWDIDIGVPQDVYRGNGSGLYYRHYTYGLVIVNPAETAKTFNFPDNLTYFDWELTGAPITGSVSVPPKSGHFYIKSQSLPSVTPSPRASVKPGDVDGNGKVDIFDFNIVLTNFGKTGTNIQGDLDNNGKVDIFDFNILLTNFGK